MIANDYKGKQFWLGERTEGWYFEMGIAFSNYQDGFFATEKEAAMAARTFIDSRTVKTLKKGNDQATGIHNSRLILD